MNVMMNYDMKSYSGAANYQVSTTSANYPMSSSMCQYVLPKSSKGKYSVLEVANWFLNKKAMSNLKLQKLCYYAQAWSYALYDLRLIDSDFQAWAHGPLSPALYERFKMFGYDKIKIVDGYISSIESMDEELLESVWLTYGNYSANALEVLTQRELPWLEARIGYGANERCRVVISTDTMKRYYSSICKGIHFFRNVTAK